MKSAAARCGLRIAIIGCGHIATYHLRPILSIVAQDCIALCDSDLLRMRRLGNLAPRAIQFSDAWTMLTSFQPNAVHVLTPPQTHAEISLAALHAGAHVLVEKPMCLSSAEAQSLFQTSKVRGLSVCVGHSFLYDPLFLRGTAIIGSGALGEIQSVSCMVAPSIAGYRLREAGHWIHKLPGGVFADVLAHPIYLAMAILGRMRLQSVTIWPEHDPVGLAFPSGLWAQLEAEDSGVPAGIMVLLRPGPVTYRLSIAGTLGDLEVDFSTRMMMLNRERMKGSLGRSIRMASAVAQTTASLFVAIRDAVVNRGFLYPGIKRLVSAFYSGLEGQSQMPFSIDEGVTVVTLMEDIFNSIGVAK